MCIRDSSNILKLKESIEKEINSNFGRRSNSAHTLVHFLFKDPVISIDKAAKECNLSFKAANDLVALMQKSNYLKELTKQSRNRIFIFEPYLKIFDNDWRTGYITNHSINMDQNRISQLQSVFDEISHFITSDDDREQAGVWFARELMVALGYARWENFRVAIGRACLLYTSCFHRCFHYCHSSWKISARSSSNSSGQIGFRLYPTRCMGYTIK